MANTEGVTKLQTGGSGQRCAQLPPSETCYGQSSTFREAGVVAPVPLDNFLAHEVKWKIQPEPGLQRGFSSFHLLCTFASSFSLARTFFSVSLSLSVGFPLSIYCYTLAEIVASRIQGDLITQGSGSGELEGTYYSSSCTDSSLYINHCTYLLHTGACMSI